MSVVEIDSELSWPDTAMRVLNEHFESLKCFEALRERIDSQMVEAVELRANTPVNKYQSVRDEVLSEVTAILTNEALLGWHCTRLTEGEVADVQSNGLQVCGTSLLDLRLARCVREGHLTDDEAKELRSKNDATSANRTNRIWFAFSRSTLSNEAAVYRLLRSWGGESVYRLHEGGPLGARLRAIGNPCIVEGSLPITDLNISSLAEHLMRTYLMSRGLRTGHSPELEGFTVQPVTGSAIVSIHRFGGQSFESLTNCSRWDRSIQ